MGKKKQELTQAQIEAIKSYGDEIVTITDFVEIVRKRPGMYLGPIGNGGFLNMIREIVQNSFDQIMKPNSPATYVIVSYDELTHEVIVEDNGMGIPYNSMIRAFTSQHTSSHFEAQKGVFQSGLHGVGSKVTNAMSSRFKVQSYIFGEGREVEFVDGKPTTDDEIVIDNKDNKQGTIVSFIPSMEALGPITVTCDEVLKLIETILPLVKEGTKVLYNCIDRDRNQRSVQLENTSGIMYFMNGFTPVLKNPIYITNVSDEMKMECLLNFDSEFISNVVCFANFCPTVKGTHLDGFIDGVAYWFKNYMNNIFLSKSTATKKKTTTTKKDKPFVVELIDIKSALRGIIHALHIEPNFTGQAKEILSNQDMYSFVKSGVSKGLDEWSAVNPNDLQKVCKFIKDIAELRLSESKTRLKLSTKYASSITGYPKKFKKPTGPKSSWEEFWICEGDSALGTAENARIAQIQGLMPVRGKILNAFNHSIDKILANEECVGIFTVIGGGYGKNFDLSKVIWNVVGCLADADVDGGHISTLFLILMLVYCRPLVEDGRVYKALPPLYSATVGGKTIYFGNRLDYVKYVQKDFLKGNKITDIDGKDISNMELMKIFYSNEDLIFELERVATNFALNPLMLELLLLNMNNGLPAIRNAIRNNFRFVKDIRQIQDTIYVNGLVDGKINTAFLNDKLIKESKSVLDILDKNERFYFKLNDRPISLYQLMKEFKSKEPKNIQRYKGLGEMSGKRLRESTLDPEGSRLIIRYSAKDIEEEVQQIRYLNSNMDLIGQGRKVSRIDLMD